MCIICIAGDEGDEFLFEFRAAEAAMKRAKERMLRCSQVAEDPAARRRYDSAHKKMARLIRDWNSIEQEREADRPDPRQQHSAA